MVVGDAPGLCLLKQSNTGSRCAAGLLLQPEHVQSELLYIN